MPLSWIAEMSLGDQQMVNQDTLLFALSRPAFQGKLSVKFVMRTTTVEFYLPNAIKLLKGNYRIAPASLHFVRKLIFKDSLSSFQWGRSTKANGQALPSLSRQSLGKSFTKLRVAFRVVLTVKLRLSAFGSNSVNLLQGSQRIAPATANSKQKQSKSQLFNSLF